MLRRSRWVCSYYAPLVRSRTQKTRSLWESRQKKAAPAQSSSSLDLRKCHTADQFGYFVQPNDSTGGLPCQIYHILPDLQVLGSSPSSIHPPPTSQQNQGPARRDGAGAPHKRFWPRQNLGAGRIHFARACSIPKGNQKRRTSYWMSFFFGASDEARARDQHPRKAALFRGPRTSGIEKSVATPRIWWR